VQDVELCICSYSTEVDRVGARRGGFGIEPAAAVDDESQAAYCDQHEKKAEQPASPTCRIEGKQAGWKKSIGDGVRGSGRLIASVAADVVGVDCDVRCGCSVGQELKGVLVEGARTTNHTVDEVLKIGRGVSGDPCGGSEFGDALDG
jgi:hypothetical protein